MNRKITVLGAGGHGVEPLLEYLSNQDTKIYYIPADWGGSTGMLGRLMELNSNFFNSYFGNKYGFKSDFFLPSADLNKIIVNFSKGKKWEFEKKNIFDFRSSDPVKLLEASQFLSRLVGEDVIVDFTHDVYDYYLAHKNKIAYEKDFCIGNLWNHLLLSRDGIEGFNRFYQDLDLLPSCINLAFTHDYRQILKGSTVVGHQTIGEDVIDVFPTALDPKSLILESTGSSLNLTDNLKFELENSELVVIPNGSIANWMPLVNHYSYIFKALAEQGKLVVMGNLFYPSNELPWQNYFEYLIKLEIFPKILFPNQDWYNILQPQLLAYAKYNHIPQSIQAIKDTHQYYYDHFQDYQRSVDRQGTGPRFELDVWEKSGVKYTAKSIEKAFERLLS